MELKKGTLLQGGKYKIEHTLGQGSFGITYLATATFSTNSNLGRMDVVAKVAVKEFFMNDLNGRKEDGSTLDGTTSTVFTNYKKRFRKEAENLSKLEHPNIVKVYDVFDENNTTYYVMEYLSDTDLNKYIKNSNGLSEDECIRLTIGIGNALQYMHNALMLHLDLKPGNIVLRNNKPVLIDFGLSKQFNSNGNPESSTSIGQGTPGYAPLEQQNYNGSQSNGLPFSMDVYALGGTMFKMVTGQTPPDASSILNDGFPASQLKEHKISDSLAEVIERAMAPSKKKRFQSVSELLSSLPQNMVTSGDVSDESCHRDNQNYSEDLTEFHQTSLPDNVAVSGMADALKVGSIIQSANGNNYTIDRVKSGRFNFTYFCHNGSNANKEFVVRELFFRDYNFRRNGVETSLDAINWLENYYPRFMEFANVLTTLPGHPNLENYVESFEANGTCYVVTEFIKGESLSDLQNRRNRNFTEKETVNIIKQVCQGLEYLRTHNLLHLDVRPSNIIKSSNRYILVDFGLENIMTIDGMTDGPSIGYVPGFSSPEQGSGTRYLSPACDVYSLGATMYTLLTGLEPKLPSDIISDGFKSLESELKKNNVSVELINVIRVAMSPWIKNRYQSSESLLKALSGIKPNSGNLPLDPIVYGKIKPSNDGDINGRKIALGTDEFHSQGDSNQEETYTDGTIQYNWMAAINLLIPGSVLILFMQNYVHTYKYDFNDLDIYGWSLVFTFILSSIIIGFNLLSRVKKISRERWNIIKIIVLSLFFVNTILLIIWNVSLTMAYVVLSGCLLVMSSIFISINKSKG